MSKTERREASAEPPMNLPAHDPKLVEQSIENARQFFRFDEQLTTEDRRRLASYFWQKTTLYPALGLPVLWGFIQAPNWLKRRAVIPANRNYRFAQIALGFVGLFVGLQFGMGVGTFVQLTQLKSAPAAQQAYALLSVYPPQLGSRYYSMTAKHPELALKNPDTIDWKSNPLFPFCLIMNRKIIDEWKRADKDRVDRYRALEQQRRQEQMQRISPPSSSPEPTGTSWDSVIAKNRAEPTPPADDEASSVASSDSGSFGLWASPPPEQAPPRVQKPAAAPPPRAPAAPRRPVPALSTSSPELGTDGLIDGQNVNQTAYTGNIEEDQRQFDELLERERQGTYVDDFSASEKKW